MVGSTEDARQILDALPSDATDSDAAKSAQARLQFMDEVADATDIASLQAQVANTPGDLKARYQLGVQLLLSGDYETGLSNLKALVEGS